MFLICCTNHTRRGYTKWSAKDTAYVRKEFKDYIMDKTFSGSKGSLPGKIKKFKSNNQA